jgi:hypothetical protein
MWSSDSEEEDVPRKKQDSPIFSSDSEPEALAARMGVDNHGFAEPSRQRYNPDNYSGVVAEEANDEILEEISVQVCVLLSPRPCF